MKLATHKKLVRLKKKRKLKEGIELQIKMVVMRIGPGHTGNQAGPYTGLSQYKQVPRGQVTGQNPAVPSPLPTTST